MEKMFRWYSGKLLKLPVCRVHYYVVAGNQCWDLDHNMMAQGSNFLVFFLFACSQVRSTWFGSHRSNPRWQGFMIRDWLPNNLLLQWLEDHCAECEFIQSAHAHLRGGAPMCHSCLFWCWIEWELHAGFTRLSAHAAQYKVSKISLSQSTLSFQPFQYHYRMIDIAKIKSCLWKKTPLSLT